MEAESRLTAWLRDYGPSAAPAFVADVTAVLQHLLTYREEIRSLKEYQEWANSKLDAYGPSDSD